jgi:hypothetical protein
MGANIAGIYGAQIFRKDDSPLYRRGFSVAIAVLCFGLVLVAFRWIDDLRRRRKNKNQLQGAPSDQESSGEGSLDRVTYNTDEKRAVPESVK